MPLYQSGLPRKYNQQEIGYLYLYVSMCLSMYNLPKRKRKKVGDIKNWLT